MRKDILGLISCPNCKGDKLFPEKEGKEVDIVSGRLVCKDCSSVYEIHEGIPHLFSTSETKSEVKKANIEYHDKMCVDYESDSSTFCIWDAHSRRRINEIMEFVSQGGKDFLLDVGCGTGNVLREAQNYFKRSFGIDISLGMLEVSRKNGFDVALADSENIPIRDDMVDVVTCFSVMHHLDDPVVFLKEAFRVLKKDGFLYTDLDPNYYAKSVSKNSRIYNFCKNIYYKYFLRSKEIDEDFESLQKLAEYHHNYTDGFKKEDLEQILSDIGFNDVKIICHSNSFSAWKNNFFTIPLYGKIEFLILSLLSLSWDYERIAPNLMVIAKK